MDPRRLGEIPAEGLTVVKSPDDGEPSIDIVFVHGFTGHPYLTWRHKGTNTTSHDDESLGTEPPRKSRKMNPLSRPRETTTTTKAVYWPADFLPATAPDARIMTYGYDTHIKHKIFGPPPSKNTVYDIGWDMLVALEGQRRDDPGRPLLFIAHSLGGIIVKEMLRRSHGCGIGRQHLQQVAAATKGVIFFGTPHSGSDPRGVVAHAAEKLVKTLGWEVNKQIVATLLPTSERLKELRDEFAPLAQKQGWLVHSFQEQLPVNLVPSVKIVDDTSSCLHCPMVEVTEHIASDHMDMCRFSVATDPEYRKVVAAVQRLLSNCRPKQTQTTHTAPEGGLAVEQCRELFKSLEFDHMGDRQSNVKRAHIKTCKWFLSLPQYNDWLNEAKLAEHSGVLWIKGNPGTGKSTLMRFIWDKTRKTLNRKSAKQPKKVISFFFHARGEELEKSTGGMYRHLLVQLLRNATDEQITAIWNDFSNDNDLDHSSPPRWTIKLLQDLFLTTVLVLKTRLVCFIDALDECDELEIREMLSFFGDVGNEALKNDSLFQVGFSSRHYPHITIDKGLELVLEGQEGHKQDIIDYLQSELKIGTSKTAEIVRAEVLEKASGIFMWVVLVTQILNKEFDSGNMRALKQRLRDIPADLHQLFQSILARDDYDKDRLLLCIQWILFAKRPLRPEELYHVLESRSSEMQTWDPEEFTPDVMRKFIVSSSKGLAEVTSSDKPSAQFIHESVRDFLLRDNGLSVLWPELGDSFEASSHDEIKCCCVEYVRGAAKFEVQFDPSDTESQGDANDTRLQTKKRQRAMSKAQREARFKAESEQLSRKFPLLEYAVSHIFYHADLAQEGGVSQLDFLLAFPRAEWIKLDNALAKFSTRRHTKDASLIYLLAEKNAGNLINCFPDKVSCVEDWKHPCKERYDTPLLAAMAHGSQEAVKRLLLQDELLKSHSELIESCLAVGAHGKRTKEQNLGLPWTVASPLLVPFLDYLDGRLRPVVRILLANAEFRKLSDFNRMRPISNRGWNPAIECLLNNTGDDLEFMELLSPKVHGLAEMPVALLPELDSSFLHRIVDLKRLKSWHSTPSLKPLHVLLEMTQPINWSNRSLLLPIRSDATQQATNLRMLQSEDKKYLLSLDKVSLMWLNELTELDLSQFILIGFPKTPHTEGVAAITELFLDLGIDVDEVDERGRTALFILADSLYSLPLVKLLLQRGASVDKASHNGTTPLLQMCASYTPSIETIKALLEAGANPNAARKHDGYAALHCANHFDNPGRITIMQILVEHGAEINTIAKDGNRPLDLARSIEVLDFLISKGAIRGASQDAAESDPNIGRLRR